MCITFLPFAFDGAMNLDTLLRTPNLSDEAGCTSSDNTRGKHLVQPGGSICLPWSRFLRHCNKPPSIGKSGTSRRELLVLRHGRALSSGGERVVGDGPRDPIQASYFLQRRKHDGFVVQSPHCTADPPAFQTLPESVKMTLHGPESPRCYAEFPYTATSAAIPETRILLRVGYRLPVGNGNVRRFQAPFTPVAT